MKSILLIFFLLPSIAAFCQSPGSTCETAINAGEPGFAFQELPPGSQTWYYFSVEASKCRFGVPAGNSFVLYEHEGDDFCGSLKGAPAKQKMLAKRNITATEAGFDLPSFSEEVMNGKCNCNSCTGGRFIEELKLKPGITYYFLVIGEGKDVKLEFISPVSADSRTKDKKPGNKTTSVNAASSKDPNNTDFLQKYIRQKPLEQLDVGESAILKSVNFEHRSTKLLEEAELDLERLYKFMKLYPKVKIEVQGHVDGSSKTSANKAEEEFALKLSEGRAKAVRDHLVKKGIDASRITYKGYGTSGMVYFGNFENYMKYNRRVEVKILGK